MIENFYFYSDIWDQGPLKEESHQEQISMKQPHNEQPPIE